MEPTVSIIVPVYNAEQTLARCVDSILKQEYTDFELLLVDDGARTAPPPCATPTPPRTAGYV